MDKPSKIAQIVENLPWFTKLQILQLIKGWSQQEAAKHYGTSQRQVWGWNNGKIIPRPNSCKTIAEAHNLDPADIFPAEMLQVKRPQK